MNGVRSTESDKIMPRTKSLRVNKGDNQAGIFSRRRKSNTSDPPIVNTSDPPIELKSIANNRSKIRSSEKKPVVAHITSDKKTRMASGSPVPTLPTPVETPNPSPLQSPSGERTTGSKVIDVKPAAAMPTSLGIGVTLWLTKFVRNTRTMANGVVIKEVDVDVKVIRGGKDAEGKMHSSPLVNASAVNNDKKSAATPLPAKSFIEGRTLQRQGSWSHLRTKLVNAKVSDAFKVAKYEVKGVSYTTLSTIGEGGYSVVYEVFNDERDLYALKVVKFDERNTMLWDELLKEIQFLLKLKDCKHVVQMFAYEHVKFGGTDNEALYILMERGECDLSYILSQLKDDERLTPSKIRFYWEQMLEAVQGIHRMRIVHADIKPSNFIMVQGQLKLIDFGFAGYIHPGSDTLERDYVGGTKDYFSPESMSHYVINDGVVDVEEMRRRDSAIKVGFKSDMWALGIILYQLSYGGSTPFSHIAGGKLSKIQALISLEYEVELEPLPDVHLVDTMRLCLRKNPAKRATVSRLLRHPFLRPEMANK
jgi:serine/threonine-protein kinase TTK/MPS1